MTQTHKAIPQGSNPCYHDVMSNANSNMCKMQNRKVRNLKRNFIYYDISV